MITEDRINKLEEKITELEYEIKKINLVLTNKSFKDNKKVFDNAKLDETKTKAKRDTTKYIFNGNTYNKRELVYFTVKYIIQKQKIKNINDFYKIIPNKTQGSVLGVLKDAEEVCLYKGAEVRYYLDANDLIELNGKKYAICKQWSKDNIKDYIKLMKKNKIEIKEINEEEY